MIHHVYDGFVACTGSELKNIILPRRHFDVLNHAYCFGVVQFYQNVDVAGWSEFLPHHRRVDGGLVGGASLDPDEFVAICRFRLHGE